MQTIIQQGHALLHTSVQVIYIARVKIVRFQSHLLYDAQEQQGSCGIAVVMSFISYHPNFVSNIKGGT
jgi:hypothetical protein